MEHPLTLPSMGGLELTYRNQARWDEAEEQEALVMDEHEGSWRGTYRPASGKGLVEMRRPSI